MRRLTRCARKRLRVTPRRRKGRAAERRHRLLLPTHAAVIRLARSRLAAEADGSGVRWTNRPTGGLRDDGSIDATATALGVHANSVRKRLERFEERTGRSPRDSEAAIELWWALQASRLAGP